MGFRLILVLRVYHEWRSIRRWACSILGFGFSQLRFGSAWFVPIRVGPHQIGSASFASVQRNLAWPRARFGADPYFQKVYGSGRVLFWVSVQPGSAGFGQDHPGTVQFDPAQRHHGSHLNGQAKSPTLWHQKVFIGNPHIDEHY